MAEVFGTLSAALSVAALFNNAVECFGYVQLGRHYGRDYERCQLKLDVLQARLTQWGDSVGVHDETRFAPADEATIRVRTVLEEISLLFQTARKTSARYDIEEKPSQNRWPLLDNIVQGVLRRKGKDRQRASSFRQKMKWALYDGKEFQRLLTNLGGFVDDLEKLHPAERRQQQQSQPPDAREVHEAQDARETQNSREPRDASEQRDAHPQRDARDTLSDTTTAVEDESRRDSAKSDETLVMAVAENVVVEDKARVRVGNEYSAKVTVGTLADRPGLVKAHTVEAKGTSRVQVGHSYGFGSIFDD